MVGWETEPSFAAECPIHSAPNTAPLRGIFDVQWTGGHAARFLSVFLALSYSRFDGESAPSHLPLTPAVMR
jgi:hypothetical protein